MKICYQKKRFSEDHLEIIDTARSILAEYAREGLKMTLRQLYYQFVARDVLPNDVKAYKRLGTIISDGRLAGLIDWDAIEDRTRELLPIHAWQDPAEYIQPGGFRIDLWEGQPIQPEIWVEKEALIGVIERTATALRVPCFACRGYVSQSAAWEAGRRILRRFLATGQKTAVIHLGDHDPSGIDMTRDNQDRLDLFTCPTPRESEAKVPVDVVTVERIALNWDQIEEFSPPPNPAKLTDSRARGYVDQFGESSWELDALDPRTLDRLMRNAVARHRDDDLFAERKAEEERGRRLLTQIEERWEEVEEFLETTDEDEEA